MLRENIIIPFILAIFISCKRNDNSHLKSTLNTFDFQNRPSDIDIHNLLISYNEEWCKILAYLLEHGIKSKDLSENNKIFLKNKRQKIEGQLKDDVELLNYYHELIQVGELDDIDNVPNTGEYTSHKARLKQELYDDIKEQIIPVLKGNGIVCKDLEDIFQLCFGKKDVVNDSTDILIFNEEKYKGLDHPESKGSEKLKEQIYIDILKILKETPHDVLEFGINGKYEKKKETKFPIKNDIEDSILNLCAQYGIKYNNDFTSVEYDSSKCTEQEFNNFCLVFTTYLIRKFVKSFKFKKIQDKTIGAVETYNGHGILSDNKYLCFLNHQCVGLVLAIVNTALCNFEIEKIHADNVLKLNLQGLCEGNFSKDDIRIAIQNSLFEGIGFVERLAERIYNGEWSKEVTNIQDNFLTLDYRYIISCCNPLNRCFEKSDPNFFDDIKTIKFGNIHSFPSDPKTGIDDKYKIEGCYNYFLASFAVLNGIIYEGKGATFYFLNNNAAEIIKMSSEEKDIFSISKTCSKAINGDTIFKGIFDTKGQVKYSYKDFYDKILEKAYGKISEKSDNALFKIAYRTWEAIGTYVFIHNILEKQTSWMISKKLEQIDENTSSK